ncbi:hypothetical protein [Halomonas sp. H5]|uniref:hypothetical protein n=1 Tax=Halomonas sp. H5 TaxID=3423910 RepID=UPI003D36DECE
MAQNKLDEQKSQAAAWFFIAAVAIPLGFGAWFGWPGPWWAYLVAGGVIFTAGLSGWVQATQQDDIHRAIMEQNERDKLRDKDQE